MTRDELVEVLAVERHTPLPERPVMPTSAEAVEWVATVWDDSEVTTARRRRELHDAIKGRIGDRVTEIEGI